MSGEIRNTSKRIAIECFGLYDLSCLAGISFLGAFTKFRKATIHYVIFVCLSLRLSICLSVHMKQLGPYLTDFHEDFI
jgi:hypothetical protein